ncbi:hypothetical protein GF327_09410 [Candidatus Woesearchaeota archaeon]|nr:hypothetical protein [Candidatus Woesearchaeota archaeon]
MSKYLEDVSKEHAFRLKHTDIVNLYELLHELKELDQDEFKHYVGEEYNHFVSWITHIVGDTTLAEELDKVKSQDATIKILENRIKELKNQEYDIQKYFKADKENLHSKKRQKEDIKEEEEKIELDSNTEKKSPIVDEEYLYRMHLGREIALSFFLGLIIGIFIGMTIMKMTVLQ